MSDGTLILIIIVVIWFIVEAIKSENKKMQDEKELEESLLRIKRDLKKLGTSEAQLENLSYYEAHELYDKLKKQKDAEKVTQEAERRKAREVEARKEREREAKEKQRIEKAYKERTPLEVIAKLNPDSIFKEHKDYLDIKLFGHGGEFQFVYVSKEDEEMWEKYIEEGEVPEGISDSDLETQIIEAETFVHFLAMYSAEIGTKDHFIQFTLNIEPEKDEQPLRETIKSVLDLTGNEEGSIVVRYVHSKKHYIEGVEGSYSVIKGPLTKDKIRFHETYFVIDSISFHYDDFGPGEYRDFGNPDYTSIIPVSELEDFEPYHAM